MSISDNLIGALYGGAFALALGLAGPQAASPEEALTVPIGIVAGFIIGGKGIKKALPSAIRKTFSF